MTEIRGRVAVVTGGASGIGKGIATALRDEGASVVIADIEADALERTSVELGVHGVQTDVTDPTSVEALADEVERRVGPVGIVVNNAGIGPFARIQDLTLADWRLMIDVNLWGVIHGVTTFLPRLLASPEGGHIVNTGSLASLVPMPLGGAYAVTKFGVAALTETLALELAEAQAPVHVTILAPGTVRTNIATGLRNMPAAATVGGLRDVDIANTVHADARWIEPIEVGRIVTRAIRAERLWAFTHPELRDWFGARARAIDSDFEAAAAEQDESASGR